jgi:hypothetical protein
VGLGGWGVEGLRVSGVGFAGLREVGGLDEAEGSVLPWAFHISVGASGFPLSTSLRRVRDVLLWCFAHIPDSVERVEVCFINRARVGCQLFEPAPAMHYLGGQ